MNGIDPRYFLFNINTNNSYLSNAGSTETQDMVFLFIKASIRLAEEIVCGDRCFRDIAYSNRVAIADWYLLVAKINFGGILILLSSLLVRDKKLFQTSRVLSFVLAFYFFYILLNQVALSTFYGQQKIIENGQEYVFKENVLSNTFQAVSNTIQGFGKLLPSDFTNPSSPLYESLLLYPNLISFSLDELALFWMGHFIDTKTIQIIDEKGIVVFGNINKENKPHFTTARLMASRNYQLYMYELDEICSADKSSREEKFVKLFSSILHRHKKFFSKQISYTVYIGETVFNFDQKTRNILRNKVGEIKSNKFYLTDHECVAQGTYFGSK